MRFLLRTPLCVVSAFVELLIFHPIDLKRINLPSWHQHAAGNPIWAALLAVLCLVTGGSAQINEPQTFIAPKAYPIERYEAGWNKNPFTLKTAPPVVEQESFAKDLAIGSYYGDAKNPTVVVVNTKTSERITLKKTQPASNGMQLKNIRLGASRKEIVAEVTLGTQTSEVRYNDDYLKQIAGTEAARAQPGMPGQQRPGATPPGQQPKAPTPGTPQAVPKVMLPPIPQGNQGRGPAQANAGPGGQAANAVMASANRTNATMSPAVNSGNPAASPGGVPTVARRRLITPATGVQ